MKSRVSTHFSSLKKIQELQALPVSLTDKRKIEDWDLVLASCMDQLNYNHIYMMALRYRKHPRTQAFYKKRISKAKDDAFFLPDLFKLATDLDREHYATLLKNRE